MLKRYNKERMNKKEPFVIRHTFLLSAIVFVLSLALAIGALFIAYALRGQSLPLGFSLVPLHSLEILLLLYSFSLMMIYKLRKDKKYKVLLVLFLLNVILCVFLLPFESMFLNA